MKITKGKIILAIVVIYFAIMGVRNINKEKDDHQKLLDEVTIVSDGKIDKKNDGKLVLVTGKINYDGKISFLEVEKDFETFKVTRTVEDYIKEEKEDGKVSCKWVERKESDKDNKDYLFQITSTTETLPVKIGEYKLDEVGMDKVEANELFKDKIKIGDLEFDGLTYSLLEHEDNEKVGDMRVSYHYFNAPKTKYLSVLAKQENDSFVPYKLDKKKEVYNVYNGKVDTKEKLEKELDIQVKKDQKGKILFILMILGLGIFFIVDSKKNNEKIK